MVNKRRPQDITTIGQWSWNSQTLLSKVQRGTNPNDCAVWLGARGPHAPLFGAYKNNKQQMTQATRILYREIFKEDCEEKEITHSCGNRYCVNENHWEIVDIKKHGRRPKPLTTKPTKNNKWWDQ